MNGRPIGDALREWADEQEHADYLAAVCAMCNALVGASLRDINASVLTQRAERLRLEHSEKAGRPLRHVTIWLDHDKHQLNVTLDAYDPALATARLRP